ncbi:rhodanese-related sulfurtransferase [Microbacteriaceae bacterium SG_E_30_P1]|uniref:Rhodanese-related sulfurtransferase n=1 Tax=Antiquaquibacter oligotrophicus TaxID=2880260 RepID=A0ABT6KMZ0_9MICO|nr:rhodanese-like domain-containing protein [Antiquaquibacter oligotrophicus]MDH6180462.1 rhodanese-related sulfurtransferase [Antiquaquibacter oligotrophicus]UDF13800.1 sulfurtransferase [Antiquaquibacter oligotrophicus]
MTDTAAILAHFEAKLRFETDPSDVRAAQAAGESFAFIDTRGDAAWAQGRAEGAVHLPTAQIAERAKDLVAPGTPVVVYCWGPACNGATKAAIEFARLGYSVREMIGGFEYWAREGLPVLTDAGHVHRDVDTLTAPAFAVSCDC